MPSIINSDDGVVSGTSGLKTTGGNDGILSIQNNGTTNVTVTAAGSVGIGTTSPNIGGANADNAILTLKGKASTRGGIFEMGNFGTTGNDQTLGWNRYFDGSTENASIEVARASSTSTAYIKFSTNGGSGSTERMRIDSSGRVTTPNQPAFNASGVSSDSTTGAGVALPFSVLNNGIVGPARSSNYNTSTYRFTAPVAGLYFFAVAIFDASGSAYAQVSPYKNGAVLNMTDQLLAFTTAGVGSEMQTGSFLLDLAVNDYVDIRPRAGYSIKMFGGHSFFTGFLIG